MPYLSTIKTLIISIAFFLVCNMSSAQKTPETIDWSWMSYALEQQVELAGCRVTDEKVGFKTIVPLNNKHYRLLIDEHNTINEIYFYFDDATDLFAFQIKVMEKLGPFHEQGGEGNFEYESYRFSKETFSGLDQTEVTFISNPDDDKYFLYLVKRKLLMSKGINE